MREKERRTRQYARTLRAHMTDAEVILWSRLREGALGGMRFRRQHPIGPYIADFACLNVKLVIEVDGATHSSDIEVARDSTRDKYIENAGWRILRIQNDDIYHHLNAVLDTILSYAPTPAFGRTSPVNGGGKREKQTGQS